MKLSVLALSSYFVASALAANCWGSVSGIPSELLHVYWDARNQMCSNEKCALHQDCNVQTSGTLVTNSSQSSYSEGRMG